MVSPEGVLSSSSLRPTVTSALYLDIATQPKDCLQQHHCSGILLTVLKDARFTGWRGRGSALQNFRPEEAAGSAR